MNREKRLYSVTMTEDELKLFSEFLGQRNFNSSSNVPEYLDDDEEIKKLLEEINERDASWTRKVSNCKAAVAAVLGTTGGYIIHSHIQNKKKEKELAKNRFKTDSDKKKEDNKKK